MSDSRPEGVVARKPMAKAMAPNAASAMTFFVMAVATLYFGKDVLMPVTLAMLYRGREPGCPGPPAQIRAGPIRALGSYLGCLTAKRTEGQG